jgi:hypothetical protein
MQVSTDSLYTFEVRAHRNLTAVFEYCVGIRDVDAPAVQVWYASGVIYVKNVPPTATVQVVDMLGREVLRATPAGGGIPFAGCGGYVVRVNGVVMRIFVGD